MEWYKEGYGGGPADPGSRKETKPKNKIIMKGKILEIKGTGSWESQQYGTMYIYMIKLQTMSDLEFEGEANAKSKTVEGLPYKVGEEVEFEHTESGNQYPDKLKIKKEDSNYSGGGGKAKGNNRSFALSYAKDLAVARMKHDTNVHTDTESIIKQADKFVTWLDS